MVFLDIQATDLIWSFLKISPLVGAEAVAIWWLTKEMKAREKVIKEKADQINELYEYIMENDKDNLAMLHSVNNTLDKVIENQKVLAQRSIEAQREGQEDILSEIEHLKQIIDIRVSQKKG